MNKIYIITASLLCMLGVIFALYGLLLYDNSILQGLSYKGQWIVGTAGVCFSIVILIFILGTFQAQLKQLKNQEIEIENARKNLNEKSFENKFYQLLKLHNDISDNIDISAEFTGVRDFNPELYIGKKVFRRLYEELENIYSRIAYSNKRFEYYNDKTQPPNEEKKRVLLEIINIAYLELDNKYQPYIGNYFRTLFLILFNIDKEENITPSEKLFYSSLLRDQISGYELLLLFYDGLSERGNQYLKPLMEDYKFLKHIKFVDQKLIDRSNVDHKYLYEDKAFK